MPHDYQNVSYNLPHIQLQGLRGGTPGGPFLLFLHGWLDNCHSFLPMLPYLQDYDWVALDFAGHGHSDHRGPDAHYYFIDYVFDVQSLIQQQDWHDIHLVGHSMGGYVAQMLTASVGSRVRSLVCIEAFGLAVGQATDALEHLKVGFASRFRQQGRQLPTYPDLRHLHHARALAGDFDINYAELLLERNMRPVEGGYRWRTDPRVRAPSPFRFSEAQVPALLAGIPQPMQVIIGENGHQEVDEALLKWRELVAQLHETRLQGGHHLHMQYPQETAQVIIDHFVHNQRTSVPN